MSAVIRNSASLFFAEGVWHLSLFILLVAAARELGAYAYGQFSYAYAVAAILGMFAAFGLPAVLIRELAQRQEEHTFPTLLSLQMTFGAFALGILGGASALFIWRGDPFVATALLLLLVFFWTRAVLLFVAGFFRARQRMEYEAVIRVGAALLLLLAGMAILNINPGVQQLAAGYATAGVFALIFTLVFFHMLVRPLRFSVDWAAWKAFLKLAWPVGLTIVLGSVLGYVDSVMLGLFGQMTEVGWYSAAYRIAGLAVVPAAFIGVSFYPVLSQQAHSLSDHLRRTVRWHLISMAALGIPGSALGFFLGPFFIDLFYGEGFGPAGFALQLLMVMVLMQFFYLPFFFLLLAAHRTRFLLFVVGAGVAGNIALNAVLIPIFSLYGAAAASGVSYGLMALATGIFSFRRIL